MRDYSINPIITKWKLFFNYVAQLDQQIGNLYDYIKEYNPNYQILNDSSNYYSKEDLKNLNLYNDETHIINASFLNRHQGFVNNLHHDCIINFAANSNMNEIVIPNLNVHTILNPQNINYLVATSELIPKSIYDLSGYRADQIILPEGYLLLSEVKSDTGSHWSNERYNIKNYLFARVAAPATYYILNNINAIDNTTRYTGTYVPNAEGTYGVSQYYSFLPNGVNFYAYQRYNTIPAVDRQKIIIESSHILTQNGSRGVEGYNLNHRLMDEVTHEEICCDDTREIDIITRNNTAIARYNIAITNNQELFLQSFPMMVRLG